MATRQEQLEETKTRNENPTNYKSAREEVARQIVALAETGSYLSEEGDATLEYFWRIRGIANDILEEEEAST